jgi:hypothetical protein
MNLQSNVTMSKLGNIEQEVALVPLFRSDISLPTVQDATSRCVDPASLRRDPPKVSSLRLERYLNPGNPICSG